MASFGSCAQAHHGAICRFAMAHAPPATIVSSGGEEPEYGAGLWTHLRPLMMRPSKSSTRPSCACISTPPALPEAASQSMGRSRGGLTSKIHAVVDTNGLPVRLGLTAGEAHDNRVAFSLLSSLRSDQYCWLIVHMTQTGSEPLPRKGCLGQRSAQMQSKGADLLQPIPLSRPKSSRAIL